MFVKLTNSNNGNGIFLSADKVYAVYQNPFDDSSTCVFMGRGIEWKVKESPETVVMLLNSALKGR